MRIGFDVSQTGKAKAGCGYFAESLIRHLAQIDQYNEYILYPTFGDSYFDSSISFVCKINQNNFRNGLRYFLSHHARDFWRNPPINYETPLGEPEIIHANNFFCPVRLYNARLIYTLYDLSFMEFPEWTTEQNRTACFNGVFNASRYADFIVAISENSRHHFLEVFPHYPRDRIVVMHPASRFSSSVEVDKPNSLDLIQTERFWLCAGTIEPRKNHRLILRAYAKLKKCMGHPFPLVIAGGEGWLMGEFRADIEGLGLSEDVILLGYVDDYTLQWLYQNCFAFLYPSLFEGFGLPVVEAMTLGAAVITSNTSSIPEITGPAALLIDPRQEEELFQAMRKLILDQEFRVALKNKALEQARAFSWNDAAVKMLELYQTALQQPKLIS